LRNKKETNEIWVYIEGTSMWTSGNYEYKFYYKSVSFRLQTNFTYNKTFIIYELKTDRFLLSRADR
jgi:hypothetical protein